MYPKLILLVLIQQFICFPKKSTIFNFYLGDDGLTIAFSDGAETEVCLLNNEGDTTLEGVQGYATITFNYSGSDVTKFTMYVPNEAKNFTSSTATGQKVDITDTLKIFQITHKTGEFCPATKVPNKCQLQTVVEENSVVVNYVGGPSQSCGRVII